VSEHSFWFDQRQKHKKSDEAFMRELVRRYGLKDKSVIDMGSGVGFFAKTLADCGVNVTAVDLRENAVTQGKSMFGDSVKFICGDALDLHYEECYDAVLASGFSLYNVVDLNDAIPVTESFLSYLKPGGRLIFLSASNLRGSKPERSNPPLQEVVDHLVPFGTIELARTTNIQAFRFLGRFALSWWASWLARVALRFHRRNVWIVVIIRKN